MTLTLSLGSWIMCSAHQLTERNICVKLNDNHSKGSGDMERTRMYYRMTDRQTKGIPSHFAARD